MSNQRERNNMAVDQTRRLRPSDLQADKDSFAAIEAMEDYAPSNKNYTVAKIQALSDTMDSEQELETQADAAAKAARDDATAAEWDFHNAILGAKQQVTAQYGADSNEVQSVGLTKKSERAKPKRTPPASGSKT
jgi:hypothetical protein